MSMNYIYVKCTEEDCDSFESLYIDPDNDYFEKFDWDDVASSFLHIPCKKHKPILESQKEKTNE